MRKLVTALVLALTVACAKTPPNLDPTGALTFQANEAVVAVGTVQHAAIQLNEVRVCDAAAVCTPLLSDANTRIVVEASTDALTTIRKVPSGWKATSLAAMERIQLRLDAAGKEKLSVYVTAAITIINALS